METFFRRFFHSESERLIPHGRTYIVSMVVCFSALLLINQLWAAPIGQGSYTTTLPAGSAGPSDFNGNAVTPKVTADFNKPILTNSWWSSLIWQYFPDNPYSENLFAHPIAAHAFADGLGISYPTHTALNNEYHQHYTPEDLRVGLAGLNAPDTRVADYSDWAVTARWQDGGTQLEATLGHGLPFVYFTSNGGTAQVSIPAGFEGVWYNQNGVLGITVNSHHYGIFAPSSTNWNSSPPFQANLNGQNYFSVAILPDNSLATLEFYRQHAYAFVTNTEVSWNYDQANANLQTNYVATTQLKESGNGNVNRPLMALYRHQWINSPTPTTSYTYTSPRGEMKVVDSNTFSTDMRFNGVLPALPNAGTYNQAQLYGYVNDVYNDVLANPIQPSDTYWGGKAVGRLTALVPIAEQVGHTAARDEFLAQMKGLTEDWLDADDGKASLLYYNDTWDTVIGYPASFFADTQMNDHHFHWGYWIMAASTIAQYDPAWASESQWGGMINLMIRDAASMDRNDSMFPFLRYFDVYAGHGWANGPALFGSGNNQESSSEGMNFATAVILWGTETNDTAMRDLGIYMYANTVEAIEQYWFDVDEQVFPAGYDYETVGMVWGNGGAYATWWTANPEEIHGINFLPFNGGSLYLGRRPDYIDRNYNFMVAQNGGQETEWVDIIWQFQALSNPSTAIAKFGSGNYTPEAGESKAHTYHWLHNLNALGQLDTSITANTPTYAVFNNNGTRTYVAYNPSSSPISVGFSNGRCLDVQPNQIAHGAGYVGNCNGNPNPTPTATSVVPPTATIVPPTPNPNNLALNRPAMASSNENSEWVTSTASHAVDGDTNTRWSSLHSDPQWIYVDLGTSYDINRVVLNWEDAYSSDYDIQVSDNASNWQTIYSTNSGNGGIDDINVSGNGNGSTGRYVRIYGTARGTVYGHSLWEIEVYGSTVAPTATPTSIPPTPTSVPPTPTPPATGDFTNGVTSINNNTARIWFAPTNTSAWVDAHYTVNNGAQQNVRMSYNSGNGRWEWDVTGLATGNSLSYWFTYEKGGLAYDSAIFSYTHGSAPVEVLLSQNKTAVASSSENSTLSPANAVDGNSNTRWSSNFNDTEWLYIDLGQNSVINHVRLDWETAYGAEYQIQVSNDGLNWTTIHHETNGNGGVDDIAVSSTGRYVRMNGLQRGTQWGYSLYEMELFGYVP